MIFLLLLAITPMARAEDTPPVVLQNEFIKVIVNSGPSEEGRFAIETTGGNPESAADNNQPLLYGRPQPWTSFTTVRINGQDWVFGGATRRRAGLGGQVGQRLQAPVLAPQGVVTAWQMGPLKVSQQLTLVRSQTTRMKDAALIRYDLTNTSGAPMEVGLRVLLDTLLGSNDGAPFRAAGRGVSAETLFEKGQVPPFWQAFDNLSNPAVIIEGVLQEEHLSAPSLVAVANWGTLADHLWNFTPTPGRSFQREGEADMDSAAALYFETTPLAPGHTRTITTQVGVGGITTKPGNLSLGLTAKSEMAYHPRQPQVVPVVVYVENTSGFEARNVAVSLLTSPGLTVLDPAPRALGALSASAQADAFFQVRANGSSFQPQWIKAVVSSENFEENTVQRPITILDPPRLEATLTGPAALTLNRFNQYDNNPFQALVTVKNPTVWPIENVQVVLSSSSPGLAAARYEKTDRTLRLAPGAEETLDFHLQATGRTDGELAYGLSVTAPDVPPVNQQAVITVPPQRPRLVVKAQEAPLVKGAYGFVDVALEGMRGLGAGEVLVTWNPKTLRFVRKSDGTLSFWPGFGVKGGVKAAKSLASFTLKSGSQAFDGADSIQRLHFKVLSHNPEICVQGGLATSDNKAIQPLGQGAQGRHCLGEP